MAERSRWITRENRAAVLHPDAVCVDCGTDGTDEGNPLEVGHIIPWARGGSNDLHNLKPQCRWCNNKASDSMPDERQQWFNARHYPRGVKVSA